MCVCATSFNSSCITTLSCIPASLGSRMYIMYCSQKMHTCMCAHTIHTIHARMHAYHTYLHLHQHTHTHTHTHTHARARAPRVHLYVIVASYSSDLNLLFRWRLQDIHMLWMWQYSHRASTSRVVSVLTDKHISLSTSQERGLTLCSERAACSQRSSCAQS